MEFKNGISLIGAGNVAWHLAACFMKAKVKINLVISRTKENASELAHLVSSPYSTQISDVPKETDLALICASDNAIPAIAEQLHEKHVYIAHTAASIPLSVFNGNPRAGVFYPFQTFTKGIRMGELDIPFFLEANTKETYKLLESLAEKISNSTNLLESEKRKYLHVSGIMANNFSNYLFSQAFDFLQDKNLDPDFLRPLIYETVYKLKGNKPGEIQTGPAKRGSLDVVESHLQLLNDNPKIKDLYSILSNSIFEYYNKKNE